ncbi:MAG TPA: phage integrase SAM-like domain-containing protein [Terriglobales bacterium]|nr:phage integrase SAM-like domain-containing protein [Terriglobales bacterium]
MHIYGHLLKRYLLPHFGAIRIKALRREQVKDFLGQLSAKGELSRNTMRLILATLRVTLNHSVEDEIIDHNPADRLGRFTKTQKPTRQVEASSGKAQRIRTATSWCSVTTRMAGSEHPRATSRAVLTSRGNCARFCSSYETSGCWMRP